jgi:hypothetical protein
METTERGARRELFESVSDDGTRWAFVIQPDHRWAITRNGKSVAAGTADRASIESGVGKFAALTHGVAGTSSRDQVIQERVDLIESQIKHGRTTKTGGTAK